jgi:hypothetical protein
MNSANIVANRLPIAIVPSIPISFLWRKRGKNWIEIHTGLSKSKLSGFQDDLVKHSTGKDAWQAAACFRSGFRCGFWK